MRTGNRTSAFKARSLRAALVAGALGLAPLAASTAATPADGALPLEASAVSVEIVPVLGSVTDSRLTRMVRKAAR